MVYKEEKIFCSYCSKKLTRKSGRCINHIWSCRKGKCAKERRKKHREFLKRKICGIRTKAQQIEDWRKAREEREGKTQIKLKIRGVFEKPIIPSLYLKKDERELLYRKYEALGWIPQAIKSKLEQDNTYLRNLMIKLRKSGVPENDLNKKFKEEFAKLLQGCVDNEMC